MKPQPLPKVFPHKPRILFTDVDDTLTWKGRLPLEAFTALINLQQAGIKVIPVTGASAGWCDCMLRTWPIETIIGENGAFYIDRNSEGRIATHFVIDAVVRASNWRRLQQLKNDAIGKFANAHSTADQPYRLTDIAFDINQDQQIARSDAFEIAKFCEASGMNARVSSIHINVWCGVYNKASSALAWLDQNHVDSSEAMFIGDSPNDDSMFSSFAHTVGVANIEPFINELKSAPTYITRQSGGYGFAEMAASIIEALPIDRSD
ncbi:MAG: HAD superfamily hydrolase (TIGR01484 family) [Pseudohongiellaceae bacterium]